MSGFGIAAGCAFASLALAGLGLGLSTRGYHPRTFAAGLLGLLGAAATTTWMVQSGVALEERKPVCPQITVQSTCMPTEPQGAGHKVGLTVLSYQIKTLRTDLKRTHDMLESERSSHKADKENLQQAEQKIVDLKKQIEMLTKLELLRTRLGKPITTHAYTWQPIDTGSPIGGSNAAAYAVRLKIDGNTIEFDDRKFTLPPAAIAASQASAQRLWDDNLAPVVAAGKTVRLFVRGTADTRRVAGATDVPDVDELRVLPQAVGGRYATAAQRRQIRHPVMNADLPDLRADWVARAILPQVAPPGTPIAILGNQPHAGDGRTVDLIVEIGW